MKISRRLVMLSVTALSMIGSVTYGCSGDDTNSGTPSDNTDSGSGGGDKDVSTTFDNYVPPQDSGNTTTGKSAVAQIRSVHDASTVTGTATFTTIDGGVQAVVTIEHALPPGDAGGHGLHIHANGSCDDHANAAGSHWNPGDASAHGYPETAPALHHLGDMGNMPIGTNGGGTYTFTTPQWTIAADAGNSVVGHAIVLHADMDDGTTQPTGKSGEKVGCGVIELK